MLDKELIVDGPARTQENAVRQEHSDAEQTNQTNRNQAPSRETKECLYRSRDSDACSSFSKEFRTARIIRGTVGRVRAICSCTLSARGNSIQLPGLLCGPTEQKLIFTVR